MQLPLLPFQILRERTDRPTGHKNCPSSSLPFPISTPEWEGFRKLFLFLLAPPFISHIFLFSLSPLCVCGSFLRVRPWKTEEKRPAKQYVSGWFFKKKNSRRRLSFSLPFFLPKYYALFWEIAVRVPLFILTRSEDLSSSYFFPSAALIV